MERHERELDAMILRAAAGVLLKRTKKPKGFWLQVIVKTLRKTADRIENGS